MSKIRVWEPYPEEIKESGLGELEVQVFQPQAHHVVMGASGKAGREVYQEEMQALNMPLYKRKGGGGTVLLGPETLVVTVHAGVAHTFLNGAYFAAINRALIACFRDWRDADYSQKGLSDIAVGDRKLVGSSIFRRRQYLLYQASILVQPDLALMARVLRHPPREPDYREGRGHEGFLTSLRSLDIDLSNEVMIADLQRNLPARLRAEIDRVDCGYS